MVVILVYLKTSFVSLGQEGVECEKGDKARLNEESIGHFQRDKKQGREKASKIQYLVDERRNTRLTDKLTYKKKLRENDWEELEYKNKIYNQQRGYPNNGTG